MKTIKFSLLLFLATAGLALGSCNKDNSDADASSDSDTYIRFTIDGTEYDFINIVSATSNSFTINGDSAPAQDESGDTAVALWLPLTFVKGTYGIVPDFADSDSYRMTFTSDDLDFKFKFADNGSVTIATITDEFIEGTFTATVTNDFDETVALKNGTFKAYTID